MYAEDQVVCTNEVQDDLEEVQLSYKSSVVFFFFFEMSFLF